MLALLKSMLVTYSSLTKSLLSPPPPPPSDPDGAMQYAEWQPHNDWLRILSENLIAAANDLRPLQARVNIEHMLRSQLDTRRAETAEIHAYVTLFRLSSPEMK
jgi:mediator of RNA polymerase II transcription subunit 7